MLVSLKYNKIPTIPENVIIIDKNIGYDTKKMWTEYQLINRLLYRSQNQHKSSFALQHLKEVKRLGERIGKLEIWLKTNYYNVDIGEKLFDFVGYLNTLRLLVEKNLEACRKTFYFYSHYLDQALFVPLASVVIGSLGGLHSESMNWHKYIIILYDSLIDKLRKQFGNQKVSDWCKENHLEEKCKIIESAKLLKYSNAQPVESKVSGEVEKKSYKKIKTSKVKNNNEIDDIFNSL